MPKYWRWYRNVRTYFFTVKKYKGRGFCAMRWTVDSYGELLNKRGGEIRLRLLVGFVLIGGIFQVFILRFLTVAALWWVFVFNGGWLPTYLRAGR